MNDCIFCKIVKGDIPSFRVFENDTHLAFLDINPNTKGVTLVITKEHYTSNTLNISENIYSETLNVARQVSEMLSKKLNVERVGLAIEGTGVDHFHIKLYPFHKSQKQELHEAPERIFNETYPGYLTTQLGPRGDFEELKKLAEKML